MGKASLGIFEAYRRSYEEAYRKAIEGAIYLFYHYNLMPQRLKELAEKGPVTFDAFIKDIETFKATLPEF